MAFILRSHQKKQNKTVRKALKVDNHIIYGAATGYGKSVCIWDFVKRDLDNGERVLVLAPRRQLIFQLTDTLKTLKPLSIMGSLVKGNRKSNLIVSSRQTASNRVKDKHPAFKNITRIYVDEVHMGASFPPKKGSQFEILYNMYWDTAKWIGYSATPIDARGYRLEGWDKTIYEYQTADLIKMGFLSDYDYFAPEQIDLSSLKVNSMHEYSKESVDEVVLNASAIESVKKHWKKIKDKRKTIVFASSIQHAELLKEALKGSEVLHSKLSEKVREEVLSRFEDNPNATLINIDILTTGFDSPSVDCLIFARPIKSIPLAIQCYGRVLRLNPKDKNKRALILDLCNVHENCGLPKKVRNFNQVKPQKGEPREEIEDKTTSCPDCHRVFKMTERKVIEKVKKKYTLTKYFCPLCNSLLDEVRVDLSVVDKLVRVEEIVVVTLSGAERSELIARLVREQTKYKPAVIKFIAKAFKDKNAFGLFDEIVAELKHDEAKLWRKIWRTKQRLENTDDNNK